MTPRFKAIEQRRIKNLLLRFLQLEQGREEFKVIAREITQQWSRSTLTLNLKIDRIDQLQDKSLALIDYKTGKASSRPLSLTEDRPEDMQLPVYFTAAASTHPFPVSAINIAHLNVEKIAYSGLVANTHFHSSLKPVDEKSVNGFSWPELTQHWQQTVELLADEFIAGKANVAPVNRLHTCQYCGLEPLCRIRELDSADPAEAEAEAEGGEES